MPLWNDREYGRRLDAADRSLLVQLIAWDGGEPVGRGMVLFPGHEEWSISAHRERCAEVRDLHVVETHRRRGIATGLMRRLERAAADRRLRVGLTVSLGADGNAARALYERLGYGVAHGPFIASTSLATDSGRLAVHVVALYLVGDGQGRSAGPG